MTKINTRRLCSAVLSLLIASSPMLGVAQEITSSDANASVNAAAVGLS